MGKCIPKAEARTKYITAGSRVFQSTLEASCGTSHCSLAFTTSRADALASRQNQGVAVPRQSNPIGHILVSECYDQPDCSRFGGMHEKLEQARCSDAMCVQHLEIVAGSSDLMLSGLCSVHSLLNELPDPCWQSSALYLQSTAEQMPKLLAGAVPHL